MKLTTKFDIEDYIFFIYENEIRHGKIEELELTIYKENDPVIFYKTCFLDHVYFNHCTISEEKSFKTKKELLKSL